MAAKTRYFTANPAPNLDAGPPSENAGLTLAYCTFGSPDRPAVLMPSCYGGKLASTLPFLYATADPVLADCFIIVCGMLGGAESSSPSNAHPTMRGPKFPRVTYEDNIRLQHALCLALGIRDGRLRAYIGFSMGGQQAYHMAVLFPDFAEHVVAIVGSARTSAHNWSFLEGPKAALTASADWHDGHYTSPATKGTRAFARVYSTWALNQAWFRARCGEKAGFATLADYLDAVWDGGLGAWDANDLLCMLHTWQDADISLHGPVKGDLPSALASIKAKVLVMPSRTDLYFPPEDSMEEVRQLKRGELRIIESVWGHIAGGGGGTKDDIEFIRAEVRRFLSADDSSAVDEVADALGQGQLLGDDKVGAPKED